MRGPREKKCKKSTPEEKNKTRTVLASHSPQPSTQRNPVTPGTVPRTIRAGNGSTITVTEISDYKKGASLGRTRRHAAPRRILPTIAAPIAPDLDVEEGKPEVGGAEGTPDGETAQQAAPPNANPMIAEPDLDVEDGKPRIVGPEGSADGELA